MCTLLKKKYKLSFVGTKGESEGWMGGFGRNLCGELSLGECVNWVAGSRGSVCIDNGVAHVSAALGLPTNVIFGPTLVSKNRQIGRLVNIICGSFDCQPCQLSKRWSSCGDNIYMNIPPRDVLNRVKI